mgnify:CR=1 FL=1
MDQQIILPISANNLETPTCNLSIPCGSVRRVKVAAAVSLGLAVHLSGVSSLNFDEIYFRTKSYLPPTCGMLTKAVLQLPAVVVFPELLVRSSNGSGLESREAVYVMAQYSSSY